MEPIIARCSPTCWFSNFGHRIPGVSRSSSCLLRRIHCFPFVTPGLFPVFAQALPAYALINVDFPTFGIPTTIARTGRFRMPRLRSRSIFSLQASCTALLIAFIPAPERELTFTTEYPFPLKYSIQASFPRSSARSDLFSRISRALFFPSSSISGLRLAAGTLASTSSIIRSMSFKSSCICLRAFVI